MRPVARTLFWFSALSFATATASAYEIKIYNNCPVPLYIRGADQSVNLSPNNQSIPARSPTPLTYQVNPPWISGRIYGCWDDSQASTPIVNGLNAVVMQQHCSLAEQTITNAAGTISSNISYVDYVAMPMKIAVPNGTACINSGATNAYFDPAVVQSNCPTKLINGKACMSAYQFCADPVHGNPASAFCSKLSTVISKIPGAGGATTVQAYGCTGFFADPARCGAINRGLPYTNRTQLDFQNFYRTEPYNDYSAFVHLRLGAPGLAFPYDDYPSNAPQNNVKYGEYVNCSASTGFVVTFCASPGASAYSFLGSRPEAEAPAAAPPPASDRDAFLFRGLQGSSVAVSLEAVESEPGSAILRLVGQGLDRRVVGTLPLEIGEVELPETGVYRIVVNNAVTQETPHEGGYHVELRTSGNAWRTLKAGGSVEP